MPNREATDRAVMEPAVVDLRDGVGMDVDDAVTLARRRRQMRSLLVRAQEQERRRMAGRVHDEVIQDLTVVALRLAVLGRRQADPADGARMAALQDVLQQAIGTLRELLTQARPIAPAEPLDRSLSAYLEQVVGDDGPTWDVDDRLPVRPPSDVAVLLFRIAQEAVVNAVKHADARHLTVELFPRDGGVQLRVEDDGAGFDVAAALHPAPGHQGLASMWERAELADGWCRIDSGPGRGTRVQAWLPVEPTVVLGEVDRPR